MVLCAGSRGLDARFHANGVWIDAGRRWLDSKSGERVLDLLEQLRTDRNLTVVMVTHEGHVAERADRIVRMLDGRVDEANSTLQQGSPKIG